MTHRVLVTDKVELSGLYPIVDAEGFEVVAVDDSTGDGFVDELATAEALVIRSATRVTADMLTKAPGLRVIGRAGVGVDNVDLDAASAAGVVVFNAPGGNTIAATELTMGLILSAARRIPAADASIRAGRWDRAAFKGVELKGKTLGLIGGGRIGGEVATRCRAFEMDVIIYDPYLSEERAAELGVGLAGLNEVLEQADFISIHVPLTDETRGICGHDALARMKPTTYVINASRGGVIDESALASALHAGTIAGAALDVYESEPLAADSPLRDAPNLVLTPHLGASTAEAQVGVATEVAAKIRDYLTLGDISGAVNAAAIG